MASPQHLFVVGASGVGKTAAIEVLQSRALTGLTCHHFDSIGVPSVDEMVRTCGSPTRWQEATTHEWVARLKQERTALIVTEGATRPSFVRSAPGGWPGGIVLLDCLPSVRSYRLRGSRQQPELDTPDMHHWAAYLRGQADAFGLPIIDTSFRSPDEVADQIYALAQTVSEWATL